MSKRRYIKICYMQFCVYCDNEVVDLRKGTKARVPFM